jgi:DNA mismatch repair protein MutS
LRHALRTALKALPDIGRALGRLVVGRGGPRDLALLRDGLEEARRLHARLAGWPDPPRLLGDLLPHLTGHGELTDLLARALVPSPPIDAAQGGYIAEGYDAALDALRATGGEGRRAIAGLEAQYRQRTGIASLKIRHNNVLGYHVEVPARHADPLMRVDSGFTHRQTLAGVVRFNAPDLHDQAMRVGQAGAHALAAEAAHLEELSAAALARAEQTAAAADALARLDVAAALAERAVEGGWCRPFFVDQPCFDVEAGRHPVVEEALRKSGERFVANDLSLGEAKRLWLVTGPEHGRQVDFPSPECADRGAGAGGLLRARRIGAAGMVDRLFSRVGASDNLARGRSTFMVEMVETAAILAQATPNSFVILDEVGRGTSTYDGLAIAWAGGGVGARQVPRALPVRHSLSRVTRLAEKLDALALHHVRAREWKGDLVLLHELAPGPADRSYGIAVARLAGLPPPVLARAKAILSRLEAGRAATGRHRRGAGRPPLFAAAKPEEAPPDKLRAALQGLDVDAMSPRDALASLYDLKKLMAEGE